MMKRILATLIALILLTGTAHAATKVVVSIVPQQYFVEQVGGDLVDVSVMVQPGASPASYEPKPRQMAELSRAQLYFSIGVPFERAWLQRMKSASPQSTFIAMDAGVDKRPMARHHHHEEVHVENGEHHGIPDPHIWTAPPIVRQMAASILKGLIEADPENEAAYRKNHGSFVHKINKLDGDLQSLFAQSNQKRFMVYHPSWGYFAQTYGLTQIPIELEGKEPGPKELGELIQHAKKENIRVVFVQPQFSDRSAELIAKAIQGQVIKADPLAYDWEQNLRDVAQAFQKALR
ncbi:metal ABC transporter solute-binding protein, Zn/Mn family [Desulfovibrio oxyclinae]|uniref:metal ABC transporter solute-binding protein, Zn/Mn family n=1 Tax=Desulfovibrio oxyclinae TaxID=63560 RepID=UPI00037F9938